MLKSIRTQKLITLTALAALLGLGAACAAEDVREEFHKTYPLAKEGKVHLENVNGNVHIMTWDREEVKVDAIKHARKQEQLDEARIEIDAKADSLRIKTKYPSSRKNNSASVDYTLTVPKQARLDKVSTINGGVEIQNVSGDVIANSVNGPVNATGLAGRVDLSTVNGPVNATVAAVNNEISLKSVNGGVTLGVPPGANAEVSGTTVNGGITSDFPLEIKKSFPVGGKLNGKLGNGGAAVKMSSVNGGIRVERAKSNMAENP